MKVPAIDPALEGFCINSRVYREAAIFNNPRAARAFADYLTTLSIENQVVDEANESRVVLLDEVESKRFHAELKAFMAHPDDERYLAASWQTGEEREPPQPEVLSRVYSRKRFRLRGRRAGPVTLAVIIACVVVFIEFNLGDPLDWWRRLRFFTSWGFMFESGQWWRWVTTSISHVQVLHIVFNVLWWWDLAGNVERRQGTLRLFSLFVFLNVFSNLCQFVFSGPNFLGLSGVVYGLLGYLWAYVRVCPAYPQPLNNGVFWSMLVWLVVCMTGAMDAMVHGAVANAAHVGGLVGGLMLGFWFGWRDRSTW